MATSMRAQPLSSKRLIGAAIASATLSVLAGVAPARAQTVGPFPLSDVQVACELENNTTCVIGDKNIWDVSYAGPAGLNSQIFVSGVQTGQNYSINADFSNLPGGGITQTNAPLSIGYSIKIAPGSNFVFRGVQLASQGNVDTTTSSAEVIKDVFSSKGGALLTSLSSLNFDAAPGGGAFDLSIFGLTSLYVVDTYRMTGPDGSIFGASNTYQQIVPTTSVPGPLPLLGAAAAFSYSRKLRSKITAYKAKSVSVV